MLSPFYRRQSEALEGSVVAPAHLVLFWAPEKQRIRSASPTLALDPRDTCPPCHDETSPSPNSPSQTSITFAGHQDATTWLSRPTRSDGGRGPGRGPSDACCSHLVQVVVGLGLLQAEGLPELGGQPSQQLIEDVVVPLIFGLWSGLEAAERGAADLGDPQTHV